MKTEKKELLKNFKALIEDLLDHYEDYTEEEKNQVKEIFQKTADLNTILDKYDIEKKFDWSAYWDAIGHYFDATR